MFRSLGKYLLLVLIGIILTYITAILDASINNSLVGGRAGYPLKFAQGGLGSSTTAYFNLVLDIIFWMVVVIVVWKFLIEIIHKK